MDNKQAAQVHIISERCYRQNGSLEIRCTCRERLQGRTPDDAERSYTRHILAAIMLNRVNRGLTA